MVPKWCLNPSTCEYVSLHNKKDTVHVIELRISRQGDCPGLSQWAQCNHKVLISLRSRQGNQNLRRRGKGRCRVQSNAMTSFKGGRGPQAMEYRQPLQAERVMAACRNQRRQGPDSPKTLKETLLTHWFYLQETHSVPWNSRTIRQ